MYNIFYSYAVYKIHLNTRIVNTANMYFLRCKIRNYFALLGHKKPTRKACISLLLGSI